MVDPYNVQVCLAIVQTGLAALLFGTSAFAARRYGNPKLWMATGAFLLFAGKGAYVLYQLLAVFQAQSELLMILDLAILVLLYVSIAKR